MKSVLTIAGSDSSGGAGIQADIKTITCHKHFATSAITALTAQNTLGVTGILNVDPEFLDKELKAIFEDIYPDAIKIGMVSDKELIEVIVKNLIKYNAYNIVVDPVMVATSGAKLIDDDAINYLISKLFKVATIVTPNIIEAEIISNIKIRSKEDMEKAALIISKKGPKYVLIKGGHSVNDANDLLFKDGKMIWFYGKRIFNKNTHGTGCTLSSAIASNLASGLEIEKCVEKAKKYISDCLQANLDLGKGSGPLNHMCNITINE